MLVQLLVLGACATGPDPDERPGWVDGGEPADYPRGAYLTGTGRADELAAARDRARAELARTFRVRVESESRELTRLEAGELEQEAESRIRTRSDEVLTGVTIAETWRAPEGGAYHALAVLDRNRAALRLRQEIGELDRATERHVERAEAARDPLERVAALGRALEARRTREGLQAHLQVVGATGRGIEAPFSTAELAARHREALAAVTITPTAAGDEAEAVDAALRGALGNAGFTTATDGDYALRAELALTDRGRRDGWHWYAGRLDLSLEDAAGETRGRQRLSVRASATDEATARQRLLDKLAERLEAEVRPRVLELVTGGE
ncbi:MAG: LPP20 family lipoprotein [Pseudomonadota bacterium]